MILEIEKLVFEGEGLAHDENGQIVFVKGALPGEVVNVQIYKKNKKYAKARIIEIIKPSRNRITPACPLAKPCGGCDLAFVEYGYQLKLKQEIIKEIFPKINLLPIIKSPKQLNYRAKTQYPATQTENSKRVLAGYYKENTHEIINVKYCPAHPRIIDEIMDYFRANWKSGCYIEKDHIGRLRHINTRISNHSGEILTTFVLNAAGILDMEIEFAKNLMEYFPQIKGVLANFNSEKTNKITGENTVLIAGRDYIFEQLGALKYKIGANSFFQINPPCAELLFTAAKKLIKNKGALLDLYGGTGSIGIFMKDSATKITLVEQNSEAVRFAKENFKINNVQKYEVFEGDVKKIIQTFIRKKRWFENIIIDPPRKGSDKQTLDFAAKMTDSIIYISCNPMTLRRDFEILLKNGFVLNSLQPVDMFPNTHHIELVAHFQRSGE